MKYQCEICGYITDKPRNVPKYLKPLRCFDLCCEGPVVELKECPAMGESKTPETDVIKRNLGEYMSKGFLVAPVLEVLEKLELERDDARREREAAKDDERWLREMLADYKIPFDDHAVGRRIALNQFIHSLRAELEKVKAERDTALSYESLAHKIKMEAHEETNALRAELAKEKAMLDWLEMETKNSRTGISFDYCRYVEEGQVIEKGFRYMRHHHLGELYSNIRDTITSAMETTNQKGM